jgi:hypothetical protein
MPHKTSAASAFALTIDRLSAYSPTNSLCSMLRANRATEPGHARRPADSPPQLPIEPRPQHPGLVHPAPREHFDIDGCRLRYPAFRPPARAFISLK